MKVIVYSPDNTAEIFRIFPNRLALEEFLLAHPGWSWVDFDTWRQS